MNGLPLEGEQFSRMLSVDESFCRYLRDRTELKIIIPNAFDISDMERQGLVEFEDYIFEKADRQAHSYSHNRHQRL